MNNKLLSLCIPTYNRAEVLEDTLNNLFSNPDFDEDRIEVVVSDNCSTDNTAEVVAKFPLVRYYVNKENVRDINFAIVLGYATGKYIRLFNDTLSFKPNTLNKMLSIIQKHLNDNNNLFFYGNMFNNSNISKKIDSKEEFINEVSYLSTWIANFGIWKEDFLKIKNKEMYAELQFTQVDWSYQIVNNNNKTIIYFDNYFDVVTPKKKGGYNVFDTFVNKYLFVIKEQKLSFLHYELEKYRLCHHFIYPWLLTLFVNDSNKYSFDTTGVFKIILKKYWYEPYIYPMLLLFWFKKI